MSHLAEARAGIRAGPKSSRSVSEERNRFASLTLRVLQVVEIDPDHLPVMSLLTGIAVESLGLTVSDGSPAANAAGPLARFSSPATTAAAESRPTETSRTKSRRAAWSTSFMTFFFRVRS